MSIINNNAISDKNSKSKSQLSFSHIQNQTITNSNNIKQKRPLLVKEHTSASILSSSKTTNIVGSHYRLIRKIGEGSFGVIFEGIIQYIIKKKKYFIYIMMKEKTNIIYLHSKFY